MESESTTSNRCNWVINDAFPLPPRIDVPLKDAALAPLWGTMGPESNEYTLHLCLTKYGELADLLRLPDQTAGAYRLFRERGGVIAMLRECRRMGIGRVSAKGWGADGIPWEWMIDRLSDLDLTDFPGVRFECDPWQDTPRSAENYPGWLASEYRKMPVVLEDIVQRDFNGLSGLAEILSWIRPFNEHSTRLTYLLSYEHTQTLIATPVDSRTEALATWKEEIAEDSNYFDQFGAPNSRLIEELLYNLPPAREDRLQVWNIAFGLHCLEAAWYELRQDFRSIAQSLERECVLAWTPPAFPGYESESESESEEDSWMREA